MLSFEFGFAVDVERVRLVCLDIAFIPFPVEHIVRRECDKSTPAGTAGLRQFSHGDRIHRSGGFRILLRGIHRGVRGTIDQDFWMQRPHPRRNRTGVEKIDIRSGRWKARIAQQPDKRGSKLSGSAEDNDHTATVGSDRTCSMYVRYADAGISAIRASRSDLAM